MQAWLFRDAFPAQRFLHLGLARFHTGLQLLMEMAGLRLREDITSERWSRGPRCGSGKTGYASESAKTAGTHDNMAAMTDSFCSACEPAFAPLVERFGRSDLDESAATIYGLSPSLTLAYMNPAWYRFAGLNGGESLLADRWQLGASVMDAIPDCLRRFYADFFASVQKADDVHPLGHEYECSSADIRRLYRMTAYPITSSGGVGLIVVNSLVFESPIELPGESAGRETGSSYVDASGLIRQCSHCRKVRTVLVPAVWHWVPDLVRNPRRNVSHTLCPPCLRHYYPAFTRHG